MARMVADSSALILLAKCSLLEIVCDLFEVIVSPTVTDEVASEDLVRNYPDAALISDLVTKGAIKVKRPGSAGFTMPISLHHGEEDALLLAIKVKRALLATDDGKAIKAARFLKVPFIITPKIVAELFRLQKISFKIEVGPFGLFARSSSERVLSRQAGPIIAQIRSCRVEPNGSLPGTEVEPMGIFGSIESKEPKLKCRIRGLDRCGTTTIMTGT